MNKNYNKQYRFNGKDVIVLMGSYIGGALVQVRFYKPQDEIRPIIDMAQSELANCLPPETPVVSIPRSAVKTLIINDQELDISKDYWGRGKVCVELKQDTPGVDNLVEKILSSEIGVE